MHILDTDSSSLLSFGSAERRPTETEFVRINSQQSATRTYTHTRARARAPQWAWPYGDYTYGYHRRKMSRATATTMPSPVEGARGQSAKATVSHSNWKHWRAERQKKRQKYRTENPYAHTNNTRTHILFAAFARIGLVQFAVLCVRLRLEIERTFFWNITRSVIISSVLFLIAIDCAARVLCVWFMFILVTWLIFLVFDQIERVAAVTILIAFEYSPPNAYQYQRQSGVWLTRSTAIAHHMRCRMEWNTHTQVSFMLHLICSGDHDSATGNIGRLPKLLL